jgi:hypothetical protein
MTPVVKADGFIWLIVGIFWVIAQIAGAAAKKNSPRRPAPSGDDHKTPPADPFAELLRNLSAAQQFELPQPEYEELPEEPEPEPLFIRQNAWHPGDIEKLPDIEPLRRETPIPEAVEVSPIEAEIRPSMSAFRSTLPTIKLPSVHLSFQRLEKSGEKVPDIGKLIDPSDRKTLRRAMLSHILFSPPKALE